MKSIKPLLLLGIALSVALNGCGTGPLGDPTHTMDSVPPTPTPASSTSTRVPVPIGTIVVTSAEDSGPGTLRQAIQDANPGNTIEFDTAIFSPAQPKIINLQSTLEIFQGDLNLDASLAGVILDGSSIPNDGSSAIQIHSDGNTVSGFLVRNFPGAAIYISSGQNNLIRENVIGGSADGVALGGATTSNNEISGNYVGVLADGVTRLTNLNNGIGVGEGAHDNQIGPDNVIAFNDQFGILVQDTNTIGNTIIQNSVHDNGWGGIRLSESNNNLSPPEFLDFDLAAGTLVGTACAFCTVEIFSDSSNQGAIHEGLIEADGNGMFAIDNSTAFAGPYMTAIATDVNGNSSEFSLPTVGLRGSSTLQDGNELPKIEIVTTPYQELADNRIGHHNPVTRVDEGSCSPVEVNSRLQEVFELGTKWMHLGLDDEELYMPRTEGWFSTFEYTECQDNTISFFAEYGTNVVAVLNYWDEYVHAENLPDYGNGEEVQRFLEYTRFLVSHFKGRIQYYEILNEPNLYVEVADYIDLIRQVVPVIHEEDPEAKIVVGAVTGLEGTDSRDYLFEILQSDIMPIVDVISIHPMYGTSPQYDQLGEYYYSYPSLIQEIKDTATANGFGGDYMASEMTWGTSESPIPHIPWVFTYTAAAKYYARAIVMNLGMNVVAGVGNVHSEVADPFIVRTIRNLSEVVAGARAIDFPLEIQGEHTRIASYSFSLPDDEMLIALWTDGVAVDNDPGVPSTLIIPGHAGQRATGIDALHDFEQELISTNVNGSLVIHDFLLRDYPIFIRLSE